MSILQKTRNELKKNGEKPRLGTKKRKLTAIGYKKAKINRDWVQNLHFNDQITQTIVSWPLWRLVTREKHSRARRRRRGRDLHRRLQN